MTDEPEHWFGIQERLETTALQRRLEQLGSANLARWSKKLPRDEIAPAVTAHVGNLLAQLALSLREKDRATWRTALERLAAALEASDHPLAELVQNLPLPPFRQLMEVVTREEILRQSFETFRHVLSDRGFGDLLLAGSTPTQTRHLFCSVQSWHSRGLSGLDPAHFDYVVLDEAHHAAASSYQAILRHLIPRVLLGLTATPERSDGRDIRDDFAGRFTHEMRLPSTSCSLCWASTAFPPNTSSAPSTRRFFQSWI